MSAGASGAQDLLRPLRTPVLAWQVAVLVVVEVLLFRSYAAHVAQFHWATHFLVGLTAGALWCTGVLRATGRPARLQLLPVLVLHLWAMWPDLAFRAGVPHAGWMDWLALGHISSHYVPGDVLSWLAVAGLAWGAYALVLRRELRRAARTSSTTVRRDA